MPSFVHSQSFLLHPADDLTERQPHLRHSAAKLAHAYASHHTVTDADLQKIGAALWNALPPEPAADFEAAIQAAGADVLPIALESPNPAVQALPWEALHHPKHGFLARNPRFAFSRRYAPPKADSSAPARPAPLKVLLFTSLPDDLDPERERLDVEKEQERVQEALLPFVVEGKVQLEMPDDGRLETLKDLLKRFQPHVLFLSGHGKFVHEPGGNREPYGVFLFESETGASDPVTEERLAEALTGSGVQVVVLSACESGKAASDDLNHGLTRRLAALGIPHVIGMRESFSDDAAIEFDDALCKALAEGERADAAIQAARAAMAAERLHVEWCLPVLFSPNPAQPAADWTKPTPAPNITPQRGKFFFIGRRKELRKYKHRLLAGALARLFISGAGGHGKTTLARKLARELEERGYKFFEWRADTPWRDFQQTLELAIEGEAGKNYDRSAVRLADQPQALAQKCFEFLQRQYGGRMVLLFDNLEALQADKTHKLTDPIASAWLNAACSDTMNFVVLATSRWILPDWNGEHLPLTGMNKGDFLRLAQALTERGRMNPLLLADRERLRTVYEALGHNPRGLEWFASATLTMNPQEEADFIAKLKQTQADLRQNMALAETLRRLRPEAFALLRRAHAYAAPVPAEGMIKLAIPFSGSDSPLPELGEGTGVRVSNPEAALENLLAFSLLEVTENAQYETLEYQLEPALQGYLRDENLLDFDPRAYHAAADFLLWLMEHERNTYPYLALTIEALRRAARHDEADRLTLDRLVGRYTLDGRYAELLTRWLPEVRNSPNPKTQAEALGQTGKLHIHIGDYKTALAYLKQSLDIRRQIGDKAGEGTTLNNISQIFKAQGDYETALAYLKQSLDIRRQIGDKAGEGTTLNNIGNIYLAQGDYETALATLKQALDIRRQIGDKAGEGTTLNNLATTAHAQGDYETALAYLKQSLDICRQIGDKAGEGTTLNNISQIFKAQGDYETALATLKQSLDIRRQIGDKAGEGTTLGNIGNIYYAQGDYETALATLKQSLDIRRQIGDKAGEGTTLGNIGNIYYAQGDYETALATLKQSLDICRQIGDKAGEGTTLNNISQIYDAQGDYETALAYLKQSLDICRQIGDKAGEGTTLGNIGNIYYAQGDYETALATLKQSLDIRRQIGDKAGLCATLFNIGHIHNQKGEKEQAVGAWVTAYVIAKQIGYAQVLQALSDLAPQLGMPAGLEGWEALAKHMKNEE